MIQITEVKITLKPNQEPLKAFASIVFENCFVIHDLRVIKVKGKVFVAMPSKKIKDANRAHEIHKDVAHPINKEMRQLIEGRVLEEYKKSVESMN